MKRLLAASLISLLSGCGHLTLDLMGHEEGHCREFGVPRDKWVYEYTDEAWSICQKKTGLIFVEACAEKWGVGRGGYECHIWIAPQYKPRGTAWRKMERKN